MPRGPASAAADGRSTMVDAGRGEGAFFGPGPDDRRWMERARVNGGIVHNVRPVGDDSYVRMARRGDTTHTS